MPLQQKIIKILFTATLHLWVSLVCAENQGRELLNPAVGCLVEKQFLPLSKVADGTFGYLLDEKSNPGKRILYVVHRPSDSRTDGLVFSLFVSDHEGRRIFSIQNNADFSLRDDWPGEISFKASPLGGTWTLDHLVTAIKEIETQSKFTLPIQNLHWPDPTVRCEAYTDPQPK